MFVEPPLGTSQPQGRTMRSAKLSALALAAACIFLGGCQMVGPTSIGLARDRYNSILQSTAMEQTMSNIVRVYHHEPPMFMDVTEVDATLSFTGSLNGGATNIGARKGTSGGTLAGQLANAAGSVQYSETPTIRYQPLLGQPLVAQLVTPVSVDALGLMYNSSWDLGPLLDLSSAYLTLDHRAFYPALNTIMELNHRGALELTAAKSAVIEQDEAKVAVPAPATAAPGAAAKTAANNDALVIYLRPFRDGAGADDLKNNQRVLQLWIRMLRIYLGSQPGFDPPTPADCTAIGLSMDKDQLRDWDVNIGSHVTGDKEAQDRVLGRARQCLPNSIELRLQPIPAPSSHGQTKADAATDFASRAPVMRTYSALGILKNATERPNPKIEFVTPELYQQIHDEPWNADDNSLSYYTLLPSDLNSVDCAESRKDGGGCDNPLPPSKLDAFNHAQIEKWIQGSASGELQAPSDAAGYLSGLDVYEAAGKDVLSAEMVDLNGRLGTLRRYILVIVANSPPHDAVYVAHSDGSRWYYIAKDDTVSQKNFQLLSLFMTMMAVPPSTQPLSPVINVGG